MEYSQDAVEIQLGDTLLMRAGQPLEFDAAAASKYMADAAAKHGTVEISVAIGDGPGQGQAWGCDLSYDYVKINAGACAVHVLACVWRWGWVGVFEGRALVPSGWEEHRLRQACSLGKGQSGGGGRSSPGQRRCAADWCATFRCPGRRQTTRCARLVQSTRREEQGCLRHGLDTGRGQCTCKTPPRPTVFEVDRSPTQTEIVHWRGWTQESEV